MTLEEIKLLFVDDEEDIVEIAEMSLSLEGISTEGALSPSAALKKLAEKKFNVIISDLTMPKDMSGEAFLKEVRSKYGKEHLFYFATGQVEKSEADFIAMGADGLLTKPFKFSDVVTKIKTHFKIP